MQYTDNYPHFRQRFTGKLAGRTCSQGELNRMILLCWKHGLDEYAACIATAYYTGISIYDAACIDAITAARALAYGVLEVRDPAGKIQEIPVNRTVRKLFEVQIRKAVSANRLFVSDSKPASIFTDELWDFVSRHR